MDTNTPLALRPVFAPLAVIGILCQAVAGTDSKRAGIACVALSTAAIYGIVSSLLGLVA